MKKIRAVYCYVVSLLLPFSLLLYFIFANIMESGVTNRGFFPFHKYLALNYSNFLHIVFLLLFLISLYLIKRVGILSFSWRKTILSITYAVFFHLGICLNLSNGNNFIIPYSRISAALNLWQITSVAIVNYYLLSFLEQTLASFSRSEKNVVISAKLYITIAFVLLILWSPYVLGCFPGSVCNDACDQIYEVIGLRPYCNDNPIFDTLLYGLLFRIGYSVFNSANAGIAIITFFQLVLYALCFSYCIVTLYDLTGSKYVLLLTFLFYVLNPTFGAAIQVVLKDSLHLPFFLLFLCLIMKMTFKDRFDLNNVLFFSLLFLLVSLTRKAAFYYALSGGIALIIYKRHEKRERRYLIVSVALCAVFFLGFENILLPSLNVLGASESSYLSLPTQTVSYVVYHNADILTADEIDAVNEVLDFDEIMTSFDPNLSDPMKRCFHGSAKDLLQLNLHFIMKYPLEVIKSVIANNWKYTYPLSHGSCPFRFYIADFSESEYDIHYMFPTLQSIVETFSNCCASLPIMTFFIGPGIHIWALLFSAGEILKKKNYQNLIPLIMLFVLAVGLLLTPVNGENRYAYPLIGAFPMIISIPYIK